MNWNCEVCGVDFIVPTNALNSLRLSATHCASCVSDLNARFIASYMKAGK